MRHPPRLVGLKQGSRIRAGLAIVARIEHAQQVARCCRGQGAERLQHVLDHDQVDAREELEGDGNAHAVCDVGVGVRSENERERE